MRLPYSIYYFRFLLAAAAAAVFFIYSSQDIAATGFGVSPSSLEFLVEKGSEVSRQLMIYNTGATTKFEAESSNPELIKIHPASGAISEAGIAIVTVTARGKAAGTKEEEISVRIGGFSSNGDSEVEILLGTGIPVKVMVINSAAAAANAFVGVMLAAGIVLVGAFAYYASRKKIRRLLFAGA
mgnify:CR=1 FL=1